MSSRPRRALAAFATVVASVLLAFVASEGIARLILDPPRYPNQPVALSPDLGFAGIPNLAVEIANRHGTHAFGLNRDGLRGRPLPNGRADEGVLRIAFLGDSFLVGEAVPEEALVTSRVEAALREQGREAEVYNLSAVGWGTGQQLLYLDQVGEALAPDVVVLAFFEGNDVVNNALGLANATDTSPGDPIRPYVVPEGDGLRVSYVDPAAAWLRARSRIFAILEQRFRTLDEGAGQGNRRERLKRGRMPLEALEIFRRHGSSERWEEAWNDTFALLEAIQARCEALGARLIILPIPAMYQVRESAEAIRFGAESRAYARRPLSTLLDWNEPERRLASFFRAAELEAVMLLDMLREAAKSSDDIYGRDSHLGVEGHRVLARVALEALEGPVAESTPASGEPFPLPVDPERYRLLDFSTESHDLRVAAGWLHWQSEADTEERPWGWAVGPAAMLALEPGPGPLVLRGFVDPHAQLPIEVTLKLIGAPLRKQKVESIGAFEIRFDKPPKGALSESGHVSLVVATSPEGGFHVEAVGFEGKRR